MRLVQPHSWSAALHKFQCNRKDEHSCEKLNQVDQFLERDRKFKMKSALTDFLAARIRTGRRVNLHPN
jgi:hypothetical protein